MNPATLAHFLAACGSDEPLRIGVGQRDQLVSDTWSFRQPFLVVGRRPESDLVLDHWQVSRRHAYLQVIEGRYYCVDLGSRTGTHGGDSAERSGWLERGRAIQIGPYAVRPEWPSPSMRPTGPSPGVTWELPGKAVGQALWRMDRHLALIGRSLACKIRIVEPDVSKFHCSVVLTPSGVWVVDLLGQNGVFVNDEAVRCARVEDGDELRIGRHTLRARYESRPLPLPRIVPPATPGASAAATLEPSDGTTFEPTSLVRFTRPGGEFPAKFAPLAMPTPPPMLQLAAGSVDPSVHLLVHQFGQMQQQMFDQFHQTMVMMFEGFAALHREQAESLRDEFDQVRKLSEELEALRKETARLAQALEKPAPDARPPVNGHRPSLLPPARPASPAQGSGSAPVLPPLAPPRRASPPEANHGVDIHSQLMLRMSTLQTERQNRWQKIMAMMSSGRD